MKRSLMILMSAVMVLSLTGAAWAQWGPGYGGRGQQQGGYGNCGQGYGNCGGPGSGNCGQGGGYGNCGGSGYCAGGDFDDAPWAKSEESRKFYAETFDLRKALNEKRFDYNEALRAGDEKRADEVVKDIEAIQDRIEEKAEKAGIYKKQRGYGRGYGPDQGGGCGGNCGDGPRRGGCGGPRGW